MILLLRLGGRSLLAPLLRLVLLVRTTVGVTQTDFQSPWSSGSIFLLRLYLLTDWLLASENPTQVSLMGSRPSEPRWAFLTSSLALQASLQLKYVSFFPLFPLKGCLCYSILSCSVTLLYFRRVFTHLIFPGSISLPGKWLTNASDILEQ